MLKHGDDGIAHVIGRTYLDVYVLVSCLTVWHAVFMGVEVLAEDSVAERFELEAPQGWQRYIQQVAHYEATFESQWRDVHNDKVLMNGSGTVKVSGAWGLSVGGDMSTDSQSVQGLNSEYAFRLRGDAGHNWRIQEITWLDRVDPDKKLEPADVSQENPEFPLGTETPGMTILCRGLMLSSNWFPLMVRSPSFELQSVSEEHRDGGLVRVDFRYIPGDDDNGYVRDGFVVLDPDRYWLIREATIRGVWGAGEEGEILIKNDFDTSLGDVPLLNLHRMDWTGTAQSGEAVHHVREIRFQDWSRSSDDETEYRLSVFGIPEPGLRVRERGKGIHLLLVLNGIIGAFGLLWLFLRRRSNASHGKRRNHGT